MEISQVFCWVSRIKEMRLTSQHKAIMLLNLLQMLFNIGMWLIVVCCCHLGTSNIFKGQMVKLILNYTAFICENCLELFRQRQWPSLKNLNEKHKGTHCLIVRLQIVCSLITHFKNPNVSKEMIFDLFRITFPSFYAFLLFKCHQR